MSEQPYELHSIEYEIEVPAEPGFHPLKFTGLPVQDWNENQLRALIEEMGEALEGLERFVREAGEEDGSVFGWAAINADEGKAARAALAKWKESK